MSSKNQEWLEFLEKIMLIDNIKDMEILFNALTTFAEREDIPKRIGIMEELYSGERTQRDIAGKLNVSIANVTRGVNTIKSIQQHADLKRIIEKISSSKKSNKKK